MDLDIIHQSPFGETLAADIKHHATTCAVLVVSVAVIAFVLSPTTTKSVGRRHVGLEW